MQLPEVVAVDVVLQVFQVQRGHAQLPERVHVVDQQALAALGSMVFADHQPVGALIKPFQQSGVAGGRREVGPRAAHAERLRRGTQRGIHQLRARGEEALDRAALVAVLQRHRVLRVEQAAILLHQRDQHLHMAGRHGEALQRVGLGRAWGCRVRPMRRRAGARPVMYFEQARRRGGTTTRRARGERRNQTVLQCGQGIQHGRAPYGGRPA